MEDSAAPRPRKPWRIQQDLDPAGSKGLSVPQTVRVTPSPVPAAEKTDDSGSSAGQQVRTLKSRPRDCTSNSNESVTDHNGSQQSIKVMQAPRECTLRSVSLDGSEGQSTREPSSPLPFIGKHRNSISISSAGSEVCAVCYNEGPDITSKCCSAPFHCHCFIQLQAQNQSCPVCRTSQRQPGSGDLHDVKLLGLPQVQSLPTPLHSSGKGRRRKVIGCCD